MIVMREIQLRLAAGAWLERASRRLAESLLFRTSDPWLNCCLQTNASDYSCYWENSPGHFGLHAVGVRTCNRVSRNGRHEPTQSDMGSFTI